MKKKKIHFLRPGAFISCGQCLVENVTKDVHKVTCFSCRRTRLFKEAILKDAYERGDDVLIRKYKKDSK